MDGVITGVFLIVAFVSLNYLAPGPADTFLRNWDSIATEALIGQIAIAIAAVFALPFSLALWRTLRSRDPRMSLAGALLFSIGALLAALLTNLMASELSTLAALYAAGGANQGAILVQANVALYGFSGPLNLSELFLFMGIVPLAGLMVRSQIFPDWVGYVGVLGALVGVISIAAGYIALFVALILGLVWIFASCGFLMRSAGPTRGAARPTSG